MTTPPASQLRAVLDRIVRDYGRNALADPVALRAAWRSSAGDGPAEPPAELLAVAAHVDRVGPPGELAGRADDLVPPAARGSGLSPDRLRPAARLLVDALVETPDPAAPGDGPATGDPTVDPRGPAPAAGGHRITWDDDPAPVPPPDRRPPRRSVLLAVVAAALVVAGAVVGLRLVDPAPTAAGEDRWAVAAVADRYRALGADLLTGAVRCARDREEPGEVERVRCDVDGMALVLRTYESPVPMRRARDTALPAGDTVRSARRVRDDGTVAMSELRSGESTVAWDAQVPRPVGASVTATTSLVDLATFLDRRRYGLVPRPDVPGSPFRSGALWSLAEVYVADEPGIRCDAIIPMTGERERVQCTKRDDDTRLNYVLMRDRESFLATRAGFADPGEAVPGTRSVTTWSRNGGPSVGTLSQFGKSDGRAVLYYDDDTLGGYGVLFGPPGGSQAALEEFWSGIVAPR